MLRIHKLFKPVLAVTLALALGLIPYKAATASVAGAGVLGFEYMYLFGKTDGAFGTDSGGLYGISLTFPIFNRDPLFNNFFQGEVWIAWMISQDSDGTFQPSSAVDGSIAVESDVAEEFELTVLQVLPGVRYKFRVSKGDLAVEPYVSLGLSVNVYLGNTDDPGDDTANGQGTINGYSGRPGGILSISPELESRNFPTGEGNILIGVTYGGGITVAANENYNIGLDFKKCKMRGPEEADFSTTTLMVGIRF